MASFVAVYDACVLYPATLRGFLMHLAVTDLFKARWSADIHDEWMRSLAKNRTDIAPERLERVRELMDDHVRDCLVTGYRDLIPALRLPDEDDRHVLAAAIRCGAAVIVTANLADFPAEVLAEYGIEAQHPDVFVSYLLDLNPAAVCAAAKLHRAQHHNPPYSVDEYLQLIERQGLPTTVSGLRPFAALL